MTGERIAGRLARLEGVSLAPGDLERVVAEWAEYERGLPIGMQLVGRWFADQLVLNAALAYETATDWGTRLPRLD